MYTFAPIILDFKKVLPNICLSVNLSPFYEGNPI